jgi:hypothetical protein
MNVNVSRHPLVFALFVVDVIALAMLVSALVRFCQ